MLPRFPPESALGLPHVVLAGGRPDLVVGARERLGPRARHRGTRHPAREHAVDGTRGNARAARRVRRRATVRRPRVPVRVVRRGLEVRDPVLAAVRRGTGADARARARARPSVYGHRRATHDRADGGGHPARRVPVVRRHPDAVRRARLLALGVVAEVTAVPRMGRWHSASRRRVGVAAPRVDRRRRASTDVSRRGRQCVRRRRSDRSGADALRRSLRLRRVLAHDERARAHRRRRVRHARGLDGTAHARVVPARRVARADRMADATARASRGAASVVRVRRSCGARMHRGDGAARRIRTAGVARGPAGSVLRRRPVPRLRLPRRLAAVVDDGPSREPAQTDSKRSAAWRSRTTSHTAC
jgi:hypothetical protein